MVGTRNVDMRHAISTQPCKKETQLRTHTYIQKSNTVCGKIKLKCKLQFQEPSRIVLQVSLVAEMQPKLFQQIYPTMLG